MAKPRNKPDGSQDVMNWDCVIPGKANARLPTPSLRIPALAHTLAVVDTT